MSKKKYIEDIKKIRKSKKLTLIELAKIMGVSQAYLTKIELGQTEPTLEQIETIKNFVEGKL